jgi:hypothetical protein
VDVIHPRRAELSQAAATRILYIPPTIGHSRCMGSSGWARLGIVRFGERRLRRYACLLAMSGALALAACEGGAPAIDRTDLVNDLAARLSQASGVDYAAQYQLAGGTSATITQTEEPPRTAYRWPGGALILTPDAMTKCSGTPLTCNTTAPPGSAQAQPAPAELLRRGLITPQRVSALLTAAVLDLGTDIQQRDSTIAGQPASCVDVAGERDGKAYDFDVCVVTDGVLGSFSGTVDGLEVEMTLTHYSRAIPADAFATTTPAR